MFVIYLYSTINKYSILFYSTKAYYTVLEGNEDGMESRCAITGQFIGSAIKVGK